MEVRRSGKGWWMAVVVGVGGGRRVYYHVYRYVLKEFFRESIQRKKKCGKGKSD